MGFFDKLLDTFVRVGLDVKKLRAETIRARMDNQQLIFKHGGNVGEYTSNFRGFNKYDIRQKKLQIQFSDTTIFQRTEIGASKYVKDLELLVYRYKHGQNKKNVNGDKRESSYKFERHPEENYRQNVFPLSNAPHPHTLDLNLAWYFIIDDGYGLKGMNKNRYNKIIHSGGTTFIQNYLRLGFKLRYTVVSTGKTYTTGFIGFITVMLHKQKPDNNYHEIKRGYITFLKD